MITIFGYPNSRATRITWMLEELGQPYDYFLVDSLKGDGKSPEFLSINPGGKVPAIKIDDLIITESAAIISHLADSFPDAGLIPPVATPARARYEQWSHFTMCELEQPLWNMGKHSFALPEDKRVPALLEVTAPWEFQQALNLFSKGLDDRDYMLGDTFSGVDILLAHTLAWAMKFKQPVEHQNLLDYVERCTQRPALQRAIVREKEQSKGA